MARLLIKNGSCRCTLRKEKEDAGKHTTIERDSVTRSEVLHWDGRLDNRSELLLRLSDSLQGESSNAAIARATYDRWGTEGLVQLIGDWSLVIRDHESQDHGPRQRLRRRASSLLSRARRTRSVVQPFAVFNRRNRNYGSRRAIHRRISYVWWLPEPDAV